QVGIVESTRRDVDKPNLITVLIRQRSSACSTKTAADRLGRMKLRRLSTKQLKLRRRECDPSDYRCTCDSPTTLTMTHHGVRRRAADAITNCPADTTAFSNGCWHRDSFPPPNKTK